MRVKHIASNLQESSNVNTIRAHRENPWKTRMDKGLIYNSRQLNIGNIQSRAHLLLELEVMQSNTPQRVIARCKPQSFFKNKKICLGNLIRDRITRLDYSRVKP